MKEILFNPTFKEHKSLVGAVKNSDEILITIQIVRDFKIHNLKLEIKNDENQVIQTKGLEEIYKDEFYYTYQVCFSLAGAGLYWYHFTFEDVYGKHFIGANHNLDAVLSDYYPISWQLLVYNQFNSDLSWFKGKVMYQIMVDRFCKGANNKPKDYAIMHQSWDELPFYEPNNNEVLNNDFFGGDIQGIIDKLPYLKDLNVGVIYLNPIFEAYSNHKYDIGDYMKIDPMFGDESDFIRLIEKAKEAQIEIILDGVFNHTGSDSVYFNRYSRYQSLGAYQSPSSPYYSWYKFRSYPNDYLCWWNFNTLPALNQANEELLKFITGADGVIAKWIKLGIKGFRLDVVDELEDGFLDRINLSIKHSDKNSILIGEVWEDASTKMGYGKRRRYLQGNQLDSIMNYPLKNAIFEALKSGNVMILVRQLRHLVNNYPKYVLDSLMNPLSTHDTIRVLNQFIRTNVDTMTKKEQADYIILEEERKTAIVYMKMATALQYTLPGVPSLYYGDEIGMDGFKDPLCRKPMQWQKINEELLSWYQMLGMLRKNEVFLDGDFFEEYIAANIFVYSRVKESKKIVIILNLSNHDYAYHFKEGYDYTRKQKVTGRIHVGRKTVRIVGIYQ